MQLRKPATAILALALSAGLAQADDAAPAAGSTLEQNRQKRCDCRGSPWIFSVPFSYYDDQQKSGGVARRITPTPLLKQ